MTILTDEDLIEAAKKFIERTKFKEGQLVRQKKHHTFLLLGDSSEVYTGNMAFVEWLPGVIGSDDNPIHHHNLIIADCIVMAHNGKGGLTPILMDSRFLEPADPLVPACDFSRD